jgi:hypothetical protein
LLYSHETEARTERIQAPCLFEAKYQKKRKKSQIKEVWRELKGYPQKFFSIYHPFELKPSIKS